MPRDRVVDVGGFALWQRERCVGRRTRTSISSTCSAWRSGAPHQARKSLDTSPNLDDEQRVGIGARTAQLADRATRVQRKGAPAVGIGRGRDGRHHARRLPFEQRTEASEVRRREADVGSGIPKRTLERSEEARRVVDVRSREQFGTDREQRAVDAQIRPVIALAKHAQERGRLSWAERHPQGVRGLEPRGGLLDGELGWHAATHPRRDFGLLVGGERR